MEHLNYESALPIPWPVEGDEQELIHDRLWTFSPSMVEDVPELPGVYALWHQGELIYYGCAATGAGHGIRACLEEHLDNYRGARRPTHYSWEIRRRPQARHLELLNRYWWAFRRLPRGNDAARLVVAVLPEDESQRQNR